MAVENLPPPQRPVYDEKGKLRGYYGGSQGLWAFYDPNKKLLMYTDRYKDKYGYRAYNTKGNLIGYIGQVESGNRGSIQFYTLQGQPDWGFTHIGNQPGILRSGAVAPASVVQGVTARYANLDSVVKQIKSLLGSVEQTPRQQLDAQTWVAHKYLGIWDPAGVEKPKIYGRLGTILTGGRGATDPFKIRHPYLYTAGTPKPDMTISILGRQTTLPTQPKPSVLSNARTSPTAVSSSTSTATPPQSNGQTQAWQTMIAQAPDQGTKWYYKMLYARKLLYKSGGSREAKTRLEKMISGYNIPLGWVTKGWKASEQEKEKILWDYVTKGSLPSHVSMSLAKWKKEYGYGR